MKPIFMNFNSDVPCVILVAEKKNSFETYRVEENGEMVKKTRPRMVKKVCYDEQSLAEEIDNYNKELGVFVDTWNLKLVKDKEVYDTLEDLKADTQVFVEVVA